MRKNDEHILAELQHQEMSRRAFLAGTGRTLSMALASAGVFYEFINQIAHKPEQVAFAAAQPLPQEQYLVPSTRIINVNSAGLSSSGPGTIPVVLHPLHNHIITAKVKVPANAKALQEAQHHLESVLQRVEQHFSPATADGSSTPMWRSTASSVITFWETARLSRSARSHGRCVRVTQ